MPYLTRSVSVARNVKKNNRNLKTNKVQAEKAKEVQKKTFTKNPPKKIAALNSDYDEKEVETENEEVGIEGVSLHTPNNNKENWKTLLVDLVTKDGLLACIVSERWIKSKSHLYYPKYTGVKTTNAVKKHELPNNSYVSYEYRTRKICGMVIDIIYIFKIY